MPQLRQEQKLEQTRAEMPQLLEQPQQRRRWRARVQQRSVHYLEDEQANRFFALRELVIQKKLAVEVPNLMCEAMLGSARVQLKTCAAAEQSREVDPW